MSTSEVISGKAWFSDLMKGKVKLPYQPSSLIEIAIEGLQNLDPGLEMKEFNTVVWAMVEIGIPKEKARAWAKGDWHQKEEKKYKKNPSAFDTLWDNYNENKAAKNQIKQFFDLVQKESGWTPPKGYDGLHAVAKPKASAKPPQPASKPVATPDEAAELATQKQELKELWDKYLDTAKNHDYAKARGAGNLADLRVVPEGMQWAGYLAIAHRDTLGDIVFLQYRSPTGELKGKGKQHSAYYTPEPLHDNAVIKTVYVSEGIGALAAMRKAFINAFHVAAAGKDRFTKVGPAIHAAFPDMEIIFVPDTGAEKYAKAAARLVGDQGWYVKPPAGKKDNYGPDDLFNEHGLDALVDVCAKRYQPDTAASTTSSTAAEQFTFVTSKEFVASMVIQSELVEKMLAKSGVAMVYGPSTVGKTFWVLYLCYCIANGLPFFGSGTTKGKVLYFAAEDDTGVQRRIAGIQKEWPDWEGIYVSSNHPDLSEDGWVQLIQEEIQEHKPALIVFDTFAACYREDFVDIKEVKYAIARLHKLAKALDCMCLFVHHTNKGEVDYSGVYTFYSDSDSVIGFDNVDDPFVMHTATVRKYKNGPKGKKSHFKFREVEIGEYPDTKKPVTTLVVDQNLHSFPGTTTGQPIDHMKGYSDAEKHMLTIYGKIGIDENGHTKPVTVRQLADAHFDKTKGSSPSTQRRNFKKDVLMKYLIKYKDGNYTDHTELKDDMPLHAL
jgi:phage/plasmid primase-like uncharacterized protein